MIYRVCHRIGPHKLSSNWNTRQEIEVCPDVLTFDGVYTEVYQHREFLKTKKRVILFIAGHYVGKDNSFDKEETLGLFCDWEALFKLKMDYGFELGWHSWSHRVLTTLTDEEVEKELTPPFHCKLLAWPYGNCNSRVANIAMSLGYTEAFSVNQGDGSQYQRMRHYLN